MSDAPAGFAPDDPTPSRPAGGAKAREWAEAKPGYGRGPLIALTLLLLFAVGGVLVAIITWPEAAPEPYLVSVPIGEYKNITWTDNPWAERDADLLCEQFKQKNQTEAGFKLFEYQQRSEFERFLTAVRESTGLAGKTGSFADRPLVIHITGLAIARNSVVYLVPADGTPTDPATWFKITDILAALDACKAKKKMLLLDLAHPLGDPFHGILVDGAAAALHSLLDTKLNDKSLTFPVLVSCGPGEQSLPSDADRCSAFALYVANGLRGAANGYDPKQPGDDGMVSPTELGRFVAARVARWAKGVAGVRQVPVLYAPAGAPSDFTLAFVRPDPSPPETPAPSGYPDPLRDAWKVRDAGRASGADRGFPAPFARLTVELTRGEQKWAGTGSTGSAGREWASATQVWQDAIGGFRSADPAADTFRAAIDRVGKFRLAAARRGRPEPPRELVVALDKFLAAQLAVTGGKEPAKDDVKKADDAKEAWKAAIKDPLDAGWAIWTRAATTPSPTQAQIAIWTAALTDLGLPLFAETMLLKRLTAAGDFYKETRVARFPGPELGALLAAELAVGLVQADGPDGFELIGTTVAEAEKQRVDGQAVFFKPTSPDDLTAQAAKLTTAAKGFEAARGTTADWRAASTARTDLVAAILESLAFAMAGDAPALDGWLAAVKTATNLEDLLGRAERGFARDESRTLAAAARAHTARLLAPFQPPAIDPLLKPVSPRSTPADLAPLRPLVAGPGPNADQRKALVEAIRADSARFATAVRALDAADDAAKTPTAAPAPTDDPNPERDRGLRRAKVTVALLKLAGATTAAKLEAQVTAFPTDPAAAEITALGEAVRSAWLVELPAQARAATDAGRTAEADRITRVIPAPVASPGPAKSPGESRAKVLAGKYKQWAAGQLAGDQPTRGTVDKAIEFYATAAADLTVPDP